jgi:hypothetical protein
VAVFHHNGIKPSKARVAEALQACTETKRSMQIVTGYTVLTAQNSAQGSELNNMHYLRIWSVGGFDSKLGLESISERLTSPCTWNPFQRDSLPCAHSTN